MSNTQLPTSFKILLGDIIRTAYFTGKEGGGYVDSRIYEERLAQELSQAVQAEREKRVQMLDNQAHFLRSLMGIIDKPFKRDPKNMVRLELIGVQKAIKALTQESK